MSTATKTKGMCIATRCTSVDQFVLMFARFVDEESFFVSTHNTRPPGLETSFSVQLADGTPVLRGLCVVLSAWTDANNVFKTPGVRLGIKRLTASSMPIFEKLLITRSATPPQTPPPIPAMPAKKPAPSGDKTTEIKRELDNVPTKLVVKSEPPKPPKPVERSRNDTEVDTDVEPDLEPEIETRTPGSDYILPANPLMNLSDASLDGFVDCTLYEETGNFFPAEDLDGGALLTDDVVPPPVLAPVPLLPPRPQTSPSITTPPPMQILAGPIDVSSLIRLSAPIEVVAPTSTSVVTPLPGILTSSSVVTPLPQFSPSSVVTPLPMMAPELPEPPLRETPRETPLPVGERVDLEPLARRKRSPLFWMVGGLGVAAAATLAIVVGSHGSSAQTKKPVEEPKVQVLAQVDLPKPTPPVEDATDETATTDSPKTGVVEDPEGPPMIGDGPCKLTVATTPAGSTISLDGKELAPSPLTVATTCAKHRFDIAHVRYQTATKSVTLVEGTPGSLDVSLNRPTHAVSVTSTPAGATVFIDGRRAGTTPAVVNVIGFQRLKVEIKKTGYQPQNVSLYSKLAQDKLGVKLKKW